MPKIFEYLGIVIRFYANEHEPIHVHALYGKEYEVKVEFEIVDHIITAVHFKTVKGKSDFPPAQKKELTKLVEEFKYVMVEEWVNFFVYNSKPTLRKITKRLA